MAFEKNSSSVDNAVAYQMMGQDQVYIRNLTPDNAIQLLKRLDHLKQVTMLTVEKEKFQPAEMSELKQKLLQIMHLVFAVQSGQGKFGWKQVGAIMFLMKITNYHYYMKLSNL